jgi:soluble lytic murein transglycosylase-like protein
MRSALVCCQLHHRAPAFDEPQMPRSRPLLVSVAMLATVLLATSWNSASADVEGHARTGAELAAQVPAGVEAVPVGDPVGAELPAAVTAAPAAVTVSRYQVRPGDTFAGIAALHGVALDELLAHNDLTTGSLIRPGDRLAIPRGEAGGAVDTGGATHAAQVRASVDRWAAEYGVDPQLVLAVTWVESRWQPAARSRAGAVGVGQLLPGTAVWVGNEVIGEPIDIYDTDDNVRGAVALLGWLIDRYDGDHAAALAAYFQGAGSIESGTWAGSTVGYVTEVHHHWWRF